MANPSGAISVLRGKLAFEQSLEGISIVATILKMLSWREISICKATGKLESAGDFEGKMGDP